MRATTGNKILNMLAKGKSVKEIADKIGCTAGYVYSTRSRAKNNTSPITPPKVKVKLIGAPDMVNHPAHYTVGGIETIDFIEAKELGYNLGNVIKYITRSGLKGDRLENLQKALWYLNREIKNTKRA